MVCEECGSENLTFHFGWVDTYNSEEYSEYKCEDCGHINKDKY